MMRYMERAAVLLAACVLIAVLMVSRQEVPPVAALATVTPSACAPRDQHESGAQHQLNPAIRVTATPLLQMAELVTLPRQIQAQVADATLTTIEAIAETAPAGSEFEQYVLTLPRQIQDQVRFQPAANATGC